MEGLTAKLVDRAIASRPRAGESVSGDAYWTEESRDGVRVAVVDGLGHGPAAAAAAERALTFIRTGGSEPLLELLERCHEGLRAGRGVALSLAHLDAQTRTVAWAGVGNVSCTLARSGPGGTVRVHSLVPVVGVLGRGRPKFAVREYPLAPGDVLVMATDGVGSGFQGSLPSLQSIERAAEQILAQFADPEDDALVVMLRYHWRSA